MLDLPLPEYPRCVVGENVDRERSKNRRRLTATGIHPAATPSSREHSLRVLVADDYRASADTMSGLIAAWGHDVHRAYDAATGTALAAACQPDVLLLDMIMSGASGRVLARQMRRQARVNNWLTIAVTGRTDAEHRQLCAEAGIDLFLVKPVDLFFLRMLLKEESEHRLRGSEAQKRISRQRGWNN